MRISHNWLQRLIKFNISPEKLSEQLTMLGLEIENIEYLGEKYRGFVVGRVVECNRHPNADRLTVCVVDVGKETLQIVCGAPNVAEGQRVAVGRVGANVPRNQHDPTGKPFTLTQAKIRGVESFGMICSEFELDMGEDSSGILVLPAKAIVGQTLARFLGVDDVTYEIGITPNRSDCLSHLGIAREIGILVDAIPKLSTPKLREGKTSIRKSLSVVVEDKENCLRFAVRMIRGVKIGPSPQWLQQVLRSVGLRPRNNVVDATNYVMMELGHPLHAFDYSLLDGGQIVVRQATEGTKLTTLDGCEHKLPVGTVMVCDSSREVSIAGVMGGANSVIGDSTVDVVLEAAYWNPTSIRRTSKRLGISTDASYRFERGTDINVIPFALDCAAELILQTAGGELQKGVIDLYPKKQKVKLTSLRPDRVNSLLGTSLSKKVILDVLRLIGVRPTKSAKDKIVFRVPSFRVDIEREIDLIEEVARVYGYNRIEDKTVSAIDFSHPFPRNSFQTTLREKLVGFGFQEAVTNSMQESRKGEMAGASPVFIQNPLSKESAVLRTSLVSGLADVVARNLNIGNSDLRLFEIGHVFNSDPTGHDNLIEGIREEEMLCMILTGNTSRQHWSRTTQPVDLFDMKGEVADLLDQLVLDKWKFIYYRTSNTLADNPISIDINGTSVGYCGCLKREVLALVGIEQDVFVAELNVKQLKLSMQRKYIPLPKFPKVRRDVAVIVDAHVPVEKIETAIRDAGSLLLQGVNLFDVYDGENLPKGKRSLAFSLEMLSREKTLTDVEIDLEVATIVNRLAQNFGAEVRSN